MWTTEKKRKAGKGCAVYGRTTAVISDLTDTANFSKICHMKQKSQWQPVGLWVCKWIDIVIVCPHNPRPNGRGETAKDCRKQYWNKQEQQRKCRTLEIKRWHWVLTVWKSVICTNAQPSRVWRSVSSLLSLHKQCVGTPSALGYLPPFSRTGFGSLCFVEAETPLPKPKFSKSSQGFALILACA